MDEYRQIEPNAVMTDLAAQMVAQAQRFQTACRANDRPEARDALHTLDTLFAAAAGLLGVTRGR